MSKTICIIIAATVAVLHGVILAAIICTPNDRDALALIAGLAAEAAVLAGLALTDDAAQLTAVCA
jgi:hypothetical protein